MRATLRDVKKHPSWIGGWWLEFPPRHRDFWWTLLLEPGQGWLRWSVDHRETGGCYDPPEPPEPYTVAPPLRRFAIYAKWWIRAPFIMWPGHRYEGRWERLSWEEARPSWSDVGPMLTDPDRHLDLWRF